MQGRTTKPAELDFLQTWDVCSVATRSAASPVLIHSTEEPGMAKNTKSTEAPTNPAAEIQEPQKRRRDGSVNRVILVGNLAADVELRYTASGIPVGRCRVATNDGPTAEFHSVIAWRGLAEVAAKFGKKGSRVYVEGRLHNRSWQSEDGAKHYAVEIVAESIRVLQRTTMLAV